MKIHSVLGQEGFSIFEILVVTSILILTMAAFPLLNSFMDTYQLTASAQNIASEMQIAKYLAVARNDQTSIHYVDGNGSDVTSNPALQGPGASIFEQTTITAIRVVDSAGNPLRPDMPLPHGVALTVVPDEPVVFNSQGGSSLVDADDTKFTVSNSTGTMDINVSPTGGRVQIVDQRAN